MSGIHLALLGMNFGAVVPEIGAPYQGGFFAGQISTAGTGVADYNLVAAPLSSGQQASLDWKTSNTSTPGTSSEIDGPANTAAMVAAGIASHPAANFCVGLTIGGFTDWYFAAKNELEVCYYNLKPTTDSNNTGSGINPNAVPPRASFYTTGTPAQTLATDFQVGNTEPFASSLFWTSTEVSASQAWRQSFVMGAQVDNSTLGKGSNFYVRAIRRVAI